VSFAKNLRRLRRRLELRQEDLAAVLGVQQGAVSRWEKGKTQPDAMTLPRLAIALNASLDELLEGVHGQYDAARDLTRHGSTGQQAPHQGGRADVPAEARVRELEDRLAAYEAIIRHVHELAGEIGSATAVGRESRATRRRAAGRR
jgi:transcriptional regulator with XRE-family HTH domain